MATIQAAEVTEELETSPELSSEFNSRCVIHVDVLDVRDVIKSMHGK